MSDAQSPADLAATLLEICLNPYIPHVPLAPQLAFLAEPGREALYGGAAGGGKSEALLMAALMYAREPGYAALLLRRHLTDLRRDGALLSRARTWLAGTDAHWDGGAQAWRFPSGAQLSFGYLAAEADPYRYQSAEFQFIGFDELTQFEEAPYLYLRSRLRRLAAAAVPLRLRSASNPGGIGHDWVHRRFVDDRTAVGRFYPSRLDDNPHLDRAAYREDLSALDPLTRAQLLEGDWTAKPEGRLFRRAWFSWANAPLGPAVLRVRAWDLAATERAVGAGRDPDWTVGARCALDAGRLVVEDVVRLRASPAAVAEALVAAAEADGPAVPVVIEQEPGASGKLVVEQFRQRLPGFVVRGVCRGAGKSVLARPLAALAEEGRLQLVPSPWAAALVDELCQFPGGRHDDQLDALSLAFAVLSQQARAAANGPALVIPRRVQ